MISRFVWRPFLFVHLAIGGWDVYGKHFPLVHRRMLRNEGDPPLGSTHYPPRAEPLRKLRDIRWR